MGNHKNIKRILIMLAMLAILFSGFSALVSSSGVVEAGSFCKSVGTGMGSDNVGRTEKGVSNSDSSNREWTVQELLGQSVTFTSYNGEGPSTFLYPEKVDRGAHVDGWEEVLPRLEASQELCIGLDFAANGLLGMAKVVSNLTGSFIMILIGKDHISEVLAKMVGGDGSSEGLIASFLTSFYFPLIVLTALIMTLTIIYKGLIQFKFREAFNSLIWVIGSFVVGLVMMLNPQLLTSVPQFATSTITTCVMGALGGQNCLTDDVAAPSVLASKECASSVAQGSSSESVVNSLNCTIWKSFILEPWAEAQFGQPYKDLYTLSPPDGGSLWANLPEGKGEEYCINFGSSSSYSDSVKGVPTMDKSSKKICNVALYQLFIKTNMKDTVSQSGNNKGDPDVELTDDTGPYDSRWYDIIVPMAKDDGRWNNWEGKSQWGSRIGVGFMSLIAIVASSTVLITLAVFAGAYKITGLILIAFAPVFFLFAMEPSRGRRIFLGWLEALVSSILKYLAITVMVVVSLSMYAGLLANTSGALSLIGVIILTFALHMYRKEIVDLIGASNMGGQKLSNKAASVGDWARKQAKEKGSAAVGGAIGGAYGASKARNDRLRSRNETIEGLKEKLESATKDGDQEAMDFYQNQINEEEELKGKDGKWHSGVSAAIGGTLGGSASSVGRTFKRGTGVMANIAQQSGRTQDDLKSIEREKNSTRNQAIEEYDKERMMRKNIENSGNNEQEQVVEEQEVNTTTVESNNVTIEEQVEIQLDKLNESIGEIQMSAGLTPEEEQAYQRLNDNIKNNYSDGELMQLVRSETALQDPNIKSIATRNLNARIEAKHELGLDLGVLGTASTLDRTESLDDFKIELEALRTQYDLSNDKADLDRYLDGMAQLSATPEQLDKSYAQALKDNSINMNNEKYRRAVEIAVQSPSIDEKELIEKLDINKETAQDMLDVMALEGIVSNKVGDPDKDESRQVIATSIDEAKVLQGIQEDTRESELNNQHDSIKKEMEYKADLVNEMRRERVSQQKEIDEAKATYQGKLDKLNESNEIARKVKQDESEAYRNYLEQQSPESRQAYENAVVKSNDIESAHAKIQAEVASAKGKIDEAQKQWENMTKEHSDIIRENEANIAAAKQNVAAGRVEDDYDSSDGNPFQRVDNEDNEPQDNDQNMDSNEVIDETEAQRRESKKSSRKKRKERKEKERQDLIDNNDTEED